MTDRTKWRPRDYLVPVTIAVLAIAALFTGRWQSKDQYTAPDAFAGCYRDGAGSLLELEATGTLRSAKEAIGGKYRIVSPVGGKHGYLVEASHISMRNEGKKIVAESGTGGFLWPISENDEMIVTFAPDTRRVLRRAPC